MKRKVNLVGPSTLSITLPAKWVKRNGVSKGDELELTEEGNKIAIEAGAHVLQQRSTTLDLRSMGSFTKKAFDALYKRGYDQVTLTYETADELKPVLEAIHDEAKSFEVVKQSQGVCVVHSISELNADEFDQLYRRTWLLLVELCSEVARALKSGKNAQLSELISLEQTNNRLTHLLRRALNRMEYGEAKDAMLLYAVIEGLEKAADELKYLCRFASDLRAQMKSETVALASAAAEFTSQFQGNVFSYSQAVAVQLSEKKHELHASAISLLEKSGKDAVVVHHLLTYVGIVYDLSGPVVALRY